MRILILEDDEFIANEISLYFQNKGHETYYIQSGEKLLESENLNKFDIFLFDINMPKISGIEVLKVLRDMGIDTPTIFLTSMSDIDYVKQAYNVGCNDYVRKPFHFEELELRISKLLGTLHAKVKKIDQTYSFDLVNSELYENTKPILLNENEKKLLYLLTYNINNVVSSDKLIEYIWDDKEINQNTLRTAIKKLRTKLLYDFIVNIRGYGYKIEES